MILLSIDPGIRGCGIAEFTDSLLTHAEYAKNSQKTGNGPVESASMALEIGTRDVDVLVLETPRVYGGRAARGDANDLFPLAMINGALAALFSSVKVVSYFPQEWKSNIDPDVMIERIKGRLSPEEMKNVILPTAKSLHHNLWDAVGIGLYHSGRLGRNRAFARV